MSGYAIPNWVVILTVSTTLVFGFVLIGVIEGAEADSEHTVGRLPDEFFAAGRAASNMPDFIPALDNSGAIVGYMASGNLDVSAGPIPVYGADLVTVIGHHIADIGFVPEGDDPADYPSRTEVRERLPNGNWVVVSPAEVAPVEPAASN